MESQLLDEQAAFDFATTHYNDIKFFDESALSVEEVQKWYVSVYNVNQVIAGISEKKDTFGFKEGIINFLSVLSNQCKIEEVKNKINGAIKMIVDDIELQTASTTFSEEERNVTKSPEPEVDDHAKGHDREFLEGQLRQFNSHLGSYDSFPILKTPSPIIQTDGVAIPGAVSPAVVSTEVSTEHSGSPLPAPKPLRKSSVHNSGGIQLTSLSEIDVAADEQERGRVLSSTGQPGQQSMEVDLPVYAGSSQLSSPRVFPANIESTDNGFASDDKPVDVNVETNKPPAQSNQGTEIVLDHAPNPSLQLSLSQALSLTEKKDEKACCIIL